MKSKNISINYHLTKACNMRCKFCFATFNDIGIVKHDFEKSIKIIDEIARNDFKKITFAGGEPTLVKKLPELIKYAKKKKLTTCIVSNGAKFAEKVFLEKIAPHTDWIALSIDSINSNTNKASGRGLNGKITLSEDFYINISNTIKEFKIKLKINTVVSSYNFNENLNHFIKSVKPDRWKILQALKVDKQNSKFQDQFAISQNEFEIFLNNHKETLESVDNAVEPVNLIKDSYLMISPEGKLYDNSEKHYEYSEPILKVGLAKALKQIRFDSSKFIERGGVYRW